MLLAKHTQGVQKKVTEFALRCGLGDFEKVLTLAARWHDEGSATTVFRHGCKGAN